MSPGGMFNKSSYLTVNGGNFTNHALVAPNETDHLLQHCALTALLDSSERMDPARCHPNTRNTVIEEIMAWIEDSNPDASMMIMYGPASSGKSALAQTIAERCKLRQRLGAAFFFSRTAPGRNNGHSLIPTIAYQLISSHPEVGHPIRMRLQRDPTLLKKSIPIVMDDLLIAPFFSWIYIVLCWITGNFLFSLAFGWVHPRLIVIDGLDECADIDIQSQILRAAATATKSLRRPFRILIACRPEMHIMQTLKESTINYVPLDLGKHNASHDIHLFLSDKFEELKHNHPLADHGSFPTSWPGSDIIAKITENASGQFIYASVIMAYIKSSKHSPVDRLNVVLGSCPKPDSDKPFATLDALYMYIFSSVEENLLLRQILSFMVIPRTADDGLGGCTTPATIAKLLSTASIDNIFLILEQLRSVINSAGPNDAIKFWHASISDFLLDEARSKGFFVDIQVAHNTLARGYLRLFQSEEPDLFMCSPFFSPLLEHYKRALPSERLRQDFITYDFFSAYKAAIGEPVRLWGLHLAWLLERVPKLFHTLVLHPQGHSIVDVYVDGVFTSYPLEHCIKESLQSFLDSKKSETVEAAIHYVLCVSILHCLLNDNGAAIANSLAEKSVIGILGTQSKAFDDLRNSSLFWSIQTQMPWSEFALACNDCISILLPHTSHCSTEFVNLLLEQQMGTPSVPEICVKAAMVGPYLEQFEDHVDAPPELKTFLEEYRASKPPSDETKDGSQILL